MTASIASLRCPVCGAPVLPDNDRCDYCGSILVLKTNHARIDPRLLNRAVIDEHIADFRQRLRNDPQDEIARYGLGVAYFNLGLVDDAVRELTEAARLMPENANIQAQLAVVLREAWRRGDSSAQRQMEYRIETALHLDPSHSEARKLQEELRAESGRPTPASAPGSSAAEYAEVWQRAVAIAIDVLLLGAVAGLVALVVDDGAARGVPAVGWIYFAAMESSTRQATIGKSLMGIKVATIGGARISFLRATGRYFARILSTFPFFFGYILALFTARRQALHDMIAGTLVVTRQTRERQPPRDSTLVTAAPANGNELN